MFQFRSLPTPCFFLILSSTLALAQVSHHSEQQNGLPGQHQRPVVPHRLLTKQVVSLTRHRVGASSANAFSSNTPLPPAVSLAPATLYDSGDNNAEAAVVADVNGDGNPDIVVVNACIDSDCATDGSVGVLLGNGDGTFQTAVTYDTAGFFAYSVAVADVNGDHKPDIVVANFCGLTDDCELSLGRSGTVSVLLGNGDGTFQAAVAYDPGGFFPISVALADVNGDSKPDLVVANECGDSTCLSSAPNGTVSVMLGNGDGTFQAATVYDAGGLSTRSVALADVNKDGKPDIVVASGYFGGGNLQEGAVGVLLGNGDGTFQTVVVYGSGGREGSSIAIRDLNADGMADLVIANEGAVGILLGNGDGTFRAAVSYGLSGFGNAVAVADVNGDGKPDVVVASSCGGGPNCGTVNVLLSNGDGTFTAAVSYASGGLGNSIAVADLNSDGKPDVVVASGFDARLVGVLINKELATYVTLIRAVREDEHNRQVADLMVLTLELAKNAAAKGNRIATDLLLLAFIDEAKDAEQHKLLKPAKAAVLILEAKALRM
ncbi:MAG TPA: FG-GAP-like repeat-containing protein [Candidatus Sulfotelmatobacter sp.]|jgi:hypothetical protein|nr:FG-GAP-like repeat-containing protein [Candidatus Sulfotelmatobacter sp.]